MSIAGVLLNSLFANVHQTSNINSTNNTNNQNTFQATQEDFQQLGQDLQAGNLTQAQQDYVTLTQALPITIGRDFGTDVEVVSGLTGRERIIDNPPDSLLDGQTVRVEQGSTGGNAQ